MLHFDAGGGGVLRDTYKSPHIESRQVIRTRTGAGERCASDKRALGLVSGPGRGR